MLWYDGSVAEAVTLSKQRNAIFVVFIEGDNELSLEMAATITEPEVVKRLSDPAHFLAIKLQSGSPHYTHFAQIYQFVPVPSLFFIGRNGTPLEVVCAGVQAANLAARIDRILEQHLKDRPVLASTSGQNVKKMSSDLIAAEGSHSPPLAQVVGDKKEIEDQVAESSSGPSPPKQQRTEFHETTRSGKEYDVVCEGDVCRRVPKANMDGAGPSSASDNVKTLEQENPAQQSQPTQPQPSPSTEPQPATSAQLIKPEASPTEPTQPSPSTALIQPTAPVQPAIDDKVEKAKELIEARRREKAAKEKELEKQKELERRAIGQGVGELRQWQADQELKQIQEERKREKLENSLARQRILEQIAQDRAERKARDQQPPAAAEQHTHDTSPGDTNTRRARIQFKLPDGTSHTAHFDAEGTLAQVHVYVSDNLQLSQSNFSLWTAFPRRELTEPDATLRSLQLTPSAALLVLPRRQNRAVTQPSQFAVFFTFITQLFTQYILEPSWSVYNWLHSRLFPPTAGRSPRTPEGSPEPPRTPGPPGIRRRGNIHRLGEHRQDDDNNTWNGNSTQQM